MPVTSDPGVVPILAGSRILEVDSSPDAHDPVVLTGVLLPAGRFIVGVSRSGTPEGGVPRTTDYRFSIEPGDPLPPSAETEPNDTPDTASPVAGPFDIGGDASQTSDYYACTIDGTPAGSAWTLRLSGTIGRGVGVGLAGPDGVALASASPDGAGHVILPDLQLASGTYTLYLNGGSADTTPYRLSASTGPAGADPEPNDQLISPVPLDPTTSLARGRLYPSGDRDLYRLTIPADTTPVLRDIKLLGPKDLHRTVCLMLPDGTSLQCRDGDGGAALRSLSLAPGDYLVQVSGDPDPDRPYVLRVDVTSDAAPDFEMEPNDDPATATPMDPSVTMRGLGGPNESDYFRLTTTGDPQLVWAKQQVVTWTTLYGECGT